MKYSPSLLATSLHWTDIIAAFLVFINDLNVIKNVLISIINSSLNIFDFTQTHNKFSQVGLADYLSYIKL